MLRALRVSRHRKGGEERRFACCFKFGIVEVKCTISDRAHTYVLFAALIEKFNFHSCNEAWACTVL